MQSTAYEDHLRCGKGLRMEATHTAVLHSICTSQHLYFTAYVLHTAYAKYITLPRAASFHGPYRWHLVEVQTHHSSRALHTQDPAYPTQRAHLYAQDPAFRKMFDTDWSVVHKAHGLDRLIIRHSDQSDWRDIDGDGLHDEIGEVPSNYICTFSPT